MKYLMTFESDPAARTHGAGRPRFQTMGAQVPSGARLIGRFTRADQTGGFDVLETDDPDALTQFVRLWSELARVTVKRISDELELGLGLSSERGCEEN